VARRFATEEGRLLDLPLLRDLALALLLLTAVGLVAIGVSGLLAGALGRVAGKDFISGDAPGVTYTGARCADYLEYHPEAADCAAAATAHHFDEVVTYRAAAGALGLLVLAGWYAARWRLRRAGERSTLPATFTTTAGAAVFGAGAVFLLGLSLPALVVGGSEGAGALLTGGVVALGVCLVYAVVLLRDLQGQREPVAE
jgi:hypothetical protein